MSSFTYLMMKWLITILLIVILFGIIAPGTRILARPLHVPHENPETASRLLDSTSLLYSYCLILNQAADSQYQNAQKSLDDLKNANLPDKIQEMTDHYSAIWQKLFTTMEELESLLDTTSTLLEHNQINEARLTLENADETIQIAGNYLKDIDVATNNLSNDLGIFSDKSTNKLTEAYSRLQYSINRLNELFDKLDQIRMNLSTQYIQMEKLIHTELSLYIDKEAAFLGDTLTVFGNLKGDNIFLSKKKVALLMNDQPIASIETESDGSYTSEITIPFEYIDTMTFIAAFEPTGEDTEILLASKSQPVIIDTTFYPTHLKVAAPEKVYPGLPFIISGEVVPYDRTQRDMKVLIDDTELLNTMIADRFHFEIDLPDDSIFGNRELTIIISPEGLYSGTVESRSIIVSTMPVSIDIQIPSVIILPKTVSFNGEVNSEFGPVTDMPVNFNFMDSSSKINTNSDGSFSKIYETTRYSR